MTPDPRGQWPRALAHYGAAVRYSQHGDAPKAQAHFGRALHYTSKSKKAGQRSAGFGGGGDAERSLQTANAVTGLLYSRVPISSYDNGDDKGGAKDYFRAVNGPWAPYFEKQKAVAGSRFGEIKATPLLVDAINVLNQRGQSILYCAYRWLSMLPTSPRGSGSDFRASIDCIRNVPGINLSIRNAKNAYNEIDMALSGLATDHPSLVFILDEVGKFCNLSDVAAGALHAADCNVFSVLHQRIFTGGISPIGSASR